MLKILSGDATNMKNSLKLRQFDKEFFARFQKELVETLGLPSMEALPAIFKLPIAVALSEGVLEQLCDRYGISVVDCRKKQLASAIGRYKRCAEYHYAMLKGEAKYDLDMKKTDPINELDRADWQRRFEHLKRQHKIGNRKAQLSAIQRQFSRM
jgi:sRNA-binding protein